MNRKRFATGAVALALALALPTGAFAASTGNHGLPNQSCEQLPMAPAGFSTSGFANAQSHYAPISQYDVACLQVSQQH